MEIAVVIFRVFGEREAERESRMTRLNGRRDDLI